MKKQLNRHHVDVADLLAVLAQNRENILCYSEQHKKNEIVITIRIKETRWLRS